MKLKEAKLCCAFSWSPAGVQKGLMVATGSVAGAMDDDFNSEAYLEIRKVDLNSGSQDDMEVVGRTLMTDRVFRIDWSPHGGANGIIAGCFTDGSVQVWSVDTILNNFAADPTKDTTDPSLCRIEAHTGPCRALQFSPTQPHYLATGGQDKELCIWTLQDPCEPAVVPALPKATHNGELTDVKWNPKFAHILATSTATGTVTVWDLKARRTALTFNVSSSQPGAANCIAWHPEISTHIAVARDDVNPVVQLWDLKKAMAPIRELRGHTKGVTGLSWNSEDSALLLSCGCDGRTMCWNPNTGDLLGELPAQDNWIYEVQWCPRATGIFSTASFESRLDVYSAQDMTASSTSATKTVPKWLRRPCGAVFGFGGRFVAPVKGTNNISVTLQTRGDATGDQTFRQSIAANPPHTPERVEFLKSLQFDVIASTESCVLSRNREPLLHFLTFHPDEVQKSVDDLELPYRKEEEEFESLLVQCIVTCRIAAGVSLCLAAGRFDDAFAVAQLASKPSDLTLRVIQQYAAVGRLRFVKYIRAVLCGSFDELIEDATLPWREVLALFATYLGDQFYTTVDAFAIALQGRGEKEGAFAGFVCSGNVNGVADLKNGTYTAQRLVQTITVIEEAVGKLCTASSFAQNLSLYATVLANAGDFEGALLLSNRAAKLGDVAAAVVADRIQCHVPTAARVAFPFAIAPIPDATSIECHMLASKQGSSTPVVAQAAQPAAAATYNQQVSPVFAQTSPLPPQQNQQSYHQQQTNDASRANNTTYAAPQPQYPPAQPVYQPAVQHQPPQQPVQQVPQQYPQPVQHGYQPVANPVPAPQEPRQPSPPMAAPNPYQQPAAPTPAPVVAHPPVVAAPAPMPPAPAVYRDPSQTTAQASTSNSRAGSQAATGAAATLPPAALSATDLSTFASAVHQEIARCIIDATAKVTDKRKRDAIEKSANELFDRLRKGLIPDDVAEGVRVYASSLGSGAAKENWRKLTDLHYEAVQHFLNIKFL